MVWSLLIRGGCASLWLQDRRRSPTFATIDAVIRPGAAMAKQEQKAEAFRALHGRSGPFVIPNPFDAGSARLLQGLGFEALATTSAGAAWTFARLDGRMGRDHALANARAIAEATDLPVSGDLENLYADDPATAAATIPLAAATGLVGCSIEDATGRRDQPIYEFDLAVRRVEVAVAAARALPFPFTLTARAENFLHGRPDLDDTIRRLKAFEAAGADVLYAPGLSTMDQVCTVVAAVKRPVNVLVSTGNAGMTVAELGAAGVRRISVGGALARAAYGAMLSAAEEMKAGTFAYAKAAPSHGHIEKRIKGTA